jgi:hypothetical protein
MGHIDDFVDSGAAQRYFQANRDKILRQLSGEHEHDQGNFDWYTDWEKWARQQWEKQQRQQQQWHQQQQQYQGSYDRQQTYQQQQQQQQQRRKREKPKVDYQWDFDVNDPYSVLGIKRGASKEEVSAAFRKQMM